MSYVALLKNELKFCLVHAVHSKVCHMQLLATIARRALVALVAETSYQVVSCHIHPDSGHRLRPLSVFLSIFLY